MDASLAIILRLCTVLKKRKESFYYNTHITTASTIATFFWIRNMTYVLIPKYWILCILDIMEKIMQ